MNCEDKKPLASFWNFIKKFPAIRYLKAPVFNVKQLYERYRDGLESGAYAFVISEFTFYGWDFKTKEWRQIGGKSEISWEDILNKPDNLDRIDDIEKDLTNHIEDKGVHFVELTVEDDLDNLDNGAYKVFIETNIPTHNEYYYLFQTFTFTQSAGFFRQMKIDSTGIQMRTKPIDSHIPPEYVVWSEWKSYSPEIRIFVEKIGINSLIYPKHFAYNQDFVVQNVILSNNAVGASFSVDGVNYDENTLAGVTIPKDVDLIINDIDIVVGYETGSLTILF